MEFKQRRVVIDNLGWEKFQSWFYENCFRSWWQLNGCIGVPLYKIYKRKSAWNKQVGELSEDQLNDIEQHGLIKPIRPARTKRNFKLERDDSIEELMKTIRAPRPRVEATIDANSKDENANDDSGRSTPEHLKKYSVTLGSDGEEEELDQEDHSKNKRGRTFSETLKMLDEDILAELNVQ